jgi:hypothetical protein
MHRVLDRAGPTGTRENAPADVAFRLCDSVGAPKLNFAAQWLACTSPCQRFGPTLTGGTA